MKGTKVLYSVQELTGFRVRATDGDVGKVTDLYFDDQEWAIRYLVVDTGPWLLGRAVLLAPNCIDIVRWQMRELMVDLSRDQVEKGPEVDLAMPVSRQKETELHQYYAWVPYWNAGARALTAAQVQAAATAENEPEQDPHLRSSREVTGYHIEATDGEIGHVEDFFVEATSWTIRYVLVDTRNWLPGRKVLIGQQWLCGVDWAESKACVDLSRNQIEQSPEYDPAKPIAHAYEVELHDHYGIPGYWMHSPV
jgi:uncharacterized protein YrrD